MKKYEKERCTERKKDIQNERIDGLKKRKEIKKGKGWALCLTFTNTKLQDLRKQFGNKI